MWKVLLLFCLALSLSAAEPSDEWEPFRKTGLFPQAGGLWVAPDMEKETVPGFTARLLDGSRQGDARAMATLGRFFFLRGDLERAAEWLGKAANAGHVGAQMDFGTLAMKGQGVPVDLVEAYKWLWLATWGDAPGADALLRELSAKIAMPQLMEGLKRAAAFQGAKR